MAIKSGCSIHGCFLLFQLLFLYPTVRGAVSSRVPDEQRLYQHLMAHYEASVRPVLNASTVINVRFKLTLNQIVDLEERTQVLTTNVFIDQEWTDENLRWDPADYNGIKTLRVPAAYVWLPDTFIFNNADDGSTGFMQGVYVLLNANGTVLWPVPVKLKSSCKVDIAYFPFDDQECILHFGSWIYSGEWMNFDSSVESVDLRYYIDNSEWDLVGMRFEKSIRQYTEEMHPDLMYTLHIRRRTFYYIFNIIVPCIMLSVLTLLTFWLPTTSGEKISLGLSVFLAFSMFMLLIAEEVPATSESVPLIGIYLTTVMTLTSVSVVMAVMVINLYNRGSKANRAPYFVKKIVLCWMCKLLRMSNDLEKLAKTIKLDEMEESRYNCQVHRPKTNGTRGSRRGSRSTTPRASLTPGEGSPCRNPNALHPSSHDLHPSTDLYPDMADTRNLGQNHDGLFEHDLRGNHMQGTTFSGVRDRNGHQLHHRASRGRGHDLGHRGRDLDTGNDLDETTTNFIINSRMKQATTMPHLGVSTQSNDIQSNHHHPYHNHHHQSIDKYPYNNNSHHKSPSWHHMPVTTIGNSVGGSEIMGNEDEDEDEEPVWQRRESVLRREKQALVRKQSERGGNNTDANPIPKQSTSRFKSLRRKSKTKKHSSTSSSICSSSCAAAAAAKKLAISEDLRKHAINEPGLEFFLNCGRHDILAGLVSSACRKEKALAERRAVIVEWQTIATVIDRLLFWIFLIGTVAAYIIILFAMPATKPLMNRDVKPFHVLKAMYKE